MDNKKIFVSLIIGLFMISMISAFDFDNVKKYDQTSRSVEVYDCDLWVGTCIIKGGLLAKSMLQTAHKVQVPVGEDQLVGIFTFQSENPNPKSIFGDIYLEDLKNGKEMVRGKQYKVKQYKVENINDYKTICINGKWNGTGYSQKCNEVEIGSHMEKTFEWKPLKNKDVILKPNTLYEIGVFVDVEELGEIGDWKPVFSGKIVPEWAEWEASLNTDLVAYFPLDAGSGNEESVVGAGSLTETGTIANQSGIVESARGTYSAGNDFNGNTDGVVVTPSTDFTVNSWWKMTGSDDGRCIVIGDIETGGYFLTIRQVSSSNKIQVVQFKLGVGANINYESGIGLTENEWTMVTVTYDGDNTKINSLYLNGVANGTDTEGSITGHTTDDDLDLGNQDGGDDCEQVYLDEVGIWDRVISQSEIENLYNGGLGQTYPVYVDQNPQITLNSPIADANYSTSPQTITFNFTASDDVNLDSVQLYKGGVLNQTNATGINNTNYFFNVTLTEGSYQFFGRATDNLSQTTDTGTINFTIDITSPNVTDALNITDLNTISIPINSTWNYTASDIHIDDCYYNTSENSTYTVITCNSTINTEWQTDGNKTIQYCANDTFGFETCKEITLTVYGIHAQDGTNPIIIAEGVDWTANLTVNRTDNIPTTTAILSINNTNYTVTGVKTGNSYSFEKTINIPIGWGNATGITQYSQWFYNISGIGNYNTSLTGLIVYSMGIDNCSSYGKTILDFDLNDEETSNLVNATAGANVEISLDLISLTNSSLTYSYNNTWTNNNDPQVCVPDYILNSSQWQMNFTVGFDSTDRVWEFYYLDNGILNSSLKYNSLTDSTIDLMDLKTDDSTSFLFNYFDQDGLAVDGSMVHVFRKYVGEGTFKEVERAKADQNGDTIVHLVEEDVIYYFVITKDGEILYTTSTYTALCQETPCTIQIEASGSGATFPTDWDLVDGGAYEISSNPTTREVTLNFTSDTTSTFNLTVYKYNSDGSYSSINTTSVTGLSGIETLTVPQSAGNVSFFATVYQDENFINSEWIDFEGDPQSRFGITLSLLISGLLILTLGLMAVTTGGVVIVWVMLGVALSGFLGLITTKLSSGINIVVYLLIAGGIILFKLTRRRN